MGGVRVRPALPGDAGAWVRMRSLLWPEEPEDHPPEVAAYFADPPAEAICLVAEASDGTLVGFGEVGMRRYAEGCRTSPVGYLEGIYVDESHRRRGAARGLVMAGEAWARRLGCTEFASDRALGNDASGAFHRAAGFDEVERIVCYRKDL